MPCIFTLCTFIVFIPWLQGELVICKNYTLGGSWNVFGQKGAGTLGGLQNLRRAGDFYEFCENVIQFFVEIE